MVPVLQHNPWPVRFGDGVSAVIAHYGDPALATALAGDLQEQAYPGPIDVIVSDDASPTPFPPVAGVRVVRSECNGGYGSAINRGVAAAAHQPWLLILNSDLRVTPNFVGDFVRAAQNWQPAICGVAQASPRGRQPAAGHFPTIASTLSMHSTSIRWVLNQVARSPHSERISVSSERTGPVDWIVGSALLLPTALFTAAGGFDTRYFMYSEEVDLQRRLRMAGVRAVLLADLNVFHDDGSSSDHLDANVQLLRSRLLYQRKWGGPWSSRTLSSLLAIGAAADFTIDCARARRVVRTTQKAW